MCGWRSPCDTELASLGVERSVPTGLCLAVLYPDRRVPYVRVPVSRKLGQGYLIFVLGR